MAEVLGDLVQRPALVQEKGGAGVAEVVAAEVWDAGARQAYGAKAVAEGLRRALYDTRDDRDDSRGIGVIGRRSGMRKT